jgi:hypothetical protein
MIELTPYLKTNDSRMDKLLTACGITLEDADLHDSGNNIITQDDITAMRARYDNGTPEDDEMERWANAILNILDTDDSGSIEISNNDGDDETLPTTLGASDKGLMIRSYL